MADILKRFEELVGEITDYINTKRLDAELEDQLMERFPPSDPVFAELANLCRQGVDAGWLCNREAGGIKYGRAIKPCDVTRGFSVDVVDMNSVVGPHHCHPRGEIDLVIPIDNNARFDGVGEGWKVYEPDSAHHPTVTDGRAIVLYLLPDGAIEFTARH